MKNLKNILNADPVSWLLENDNPSVKYFTLRDILEYPEGSQELRDAKKQIMGSGPVPEILSRQHGSGYWNTPESFYSSKYKGTVWQIIILAELGADPKNFMVKKACEFILSNSQDNLSGGFAYSNNKKSGGGRHSEVIPCLTANMVFALIRLGYLNDIRVRRGIDWITNYQRFDDGDAAKQPAGWPYDRMKASCFARHSCHMGAVKAVKALSEIPEDIRTADISNTISAGVEYILKHHIYKKSHNLSEVSKPGWLKFGFPLMYQTDVLEILEFLTRLGCRDKRMKDAIDILISKQDEMGRWTLENTYNGRFYINIEQKNKQSKWITMNALRVLKRY